MLLLKIHGIFQSCIKIDDNTFKTGMEAVQKHFFFQIESISYLKNIIFLWYKYVCGLTIHEVDYFTHQILYNIYCIVFYISRHDIFL